MARTNPIARSLHDVGLAAWFGGSLMGAVGLNGAAATANDPRERTRISSEGWRRWTPVNAAAIGAHVAGAAVLLASDRKRVAAQEGVTGLAGVKVALTAAALGVTAVSRLQGRKVQDAGPTHASGVTEPSSSTPTDVATAQTGLKPLQWAIPALTGALIVITSRMGEQQRASESIPGIAKRLLPV